MTDVDGNIYATVLIGGQCWMAAYLETERYRDGSVVPGNVPRVVWDTLGIGAWAVYGNDPSNRETSGLRYNGIAGQDAKAFVPRAGTFLRKPIGMR